VGKPIALLALGLAGTGRLFHYVKVGPSEVEEDEKEKKV
jgi:hypothetical protein